MNTSVNISVNTGSYTGTTTRIVRAADPLGEDPCPERDFDGYCNCKKVEHPRRPPRSR